MKNLKKIVDFVSRQKRVKCQLKKRGIPLFFFQKWKDEIVTSDVLYFKSV